MGYLDMEVFGYGGIWIWRYLDMEAFGYGGIWIWGYLDMEVFGYGGIWIWRQECLRIGPPDHRAEGAVPGRHPAALQVGQDRRDLVILQLRQVLLGVTRRQVNVCTLLGWGGVR